MGIFQNYTKISNHAGNLNFGVKKKGGKSLEKTPKGGDTFSKNSDKVRPDRVTRTYHKNRVVACENVYKNGEIYKDTWYDDNGKMRWVRHFDGSFDLSRNPWYEWKKAPYIELVRKQDGAFTRLHVKLDSKPKGAKGESGTFVLFNMKDKERFETSLYVEPDGTYRSYNDEGLPDLKEALSELLDIISKDEYKDGFGGSYRMNNGIRNAVRYIERTAKQPA